jgi:GNAT superfamily N-acetyltransferase
VPADVHLAETDDAIAACFGVMRQLRPHLVEGEFVDRVRGMQADGYRLAYIKENDRVVAVAGFRHGDSLAWDQFLYVDDLVTDEAARSRGYGQVLMDWLVVFARETGCSQLHLDSGVQRFAAHRFYLANRMEIRSHHFSRMLQED